MLKTLTALVCLLACTAAMGATATRRGDALANDGNYAAAAKAFAEAQRQAPQDAALAARLARANLRLGNGKQAVEWAEKATGLAPKVAKYQLLLGDANSVYVNDVSMFRKLGIAHTIRDAYKHAVALEPDNAEAHFSLAMYYLMAPGIAGGSDSEGDAQIHALTKLDPAVAFLAMAQRASKAEDHAKAETLYRKAAAVKGSPRGAVALGQFLEWRKQPAAALAQFQQITHDYPADPDAWYQIGRLAALGEADAKLGMQALETYLGLAIDWRQGNPPYCGAHYRLGQIQQRLGAPDKAREEFRKALQLDPGFKPAQEALDKLDASS